MLWACLAEFTAPSLACEWVLCKVRVVLALLHMAHFFFFLWRLRGRRFDNRLCLSRSVGGPKIYIEDTVLWLPKYPHSKGKASAALRTLFSPQVWRSRMKKGMPTFHIRAEWNSENPWILPKTLCMSLPKDVWIRRQHAETRWNRVKETPWRFKGFGIPCRMLYKSTVSQPSLKT